MFVLLPNYPYSRVPHGSINISQRFPFLNRLPGPGCSSATPYLEMSIKENQISDTNDVVDKSFVRTSNYLFIYGPGNSPGPFFAPVRHFASLHDRNCIVPRRHYACAVFLPRLHADIFRKLLNVFFFLFVVKCARAPYRPSFSYNTI